MRTKSFRTWLFSLCLAVLLLIPAAAFAAEQIVEAEGEYLVGTGLEESFSKAREMAEADAMANAAKQMAVYVEAITEVKNHQLTASEVRTLAAKVMGQVKPSSFNNVGEGDVIRIRCHVVVRVKDDDVLAALQSDKQELKESLAQLQKVNEEKESLIHENEKLARENEELNRQLQAAETGTEQAKIREQQVKIQRQAKANATSFTAMQWVEKALSAYFDKDYGQAITCFNTSIELDPKQYQAYTYLGRTYFQFKDYPKAIESIQKGLAIVPNDHRAAFPYAFLGDVYYEIGDYRQAIVCYSKALECSPYLYSPSTEAGDVYKKLTRACFSAKEGYEKAIEAYNRALTKKVMSKFFVYNYLGVIYNEKGDYDRAIEYFDKVIEQYPEDNEAYFNLGDTYSDSGEYGKARECYSKAMELEIDYGEWQNDPDKNRNEEEIARYNRVIDSIPEASKAYNNRGRCYENLGNRKAAKQDYMKAYELDPNNEIYRKNKRRSENW